MMVVMITIMFFMMLIDRQALIDSKGLEYDLLMLTQTF